MWEVGVQGVKAHPQKFWFIENTDKIPENPGKIRENLSKIYEHVRKMPAILGKLHEIWIKWRPTLFDFEKLAPKVERITLRPFYLSHFGDHSKNDEILAERVARKLCGQVWGSPSKNLSHPPKVACSYTTPMSSTKSLQVMFALQVHNK